MFVPRPGMEAVIPHSAYGAITLGGLLDELGTSVLVNVAGRIDPRIRVGALAIHDPHDPPPISPGTIVLGVGVAGLDAIAALLARLSASDAVALILKEPVEFDDSVTRVVTESGIAVFGLVRGVAWSQISNTIAARLGTAEFASEHGVLGDLSPFTGSGTDLFAMANAISALLDAPITIEDLNSQILAFSSDQARGDEARKRCILGQRVPDSYLGLLKDRGMFQKIYASPRPVFVAIDGDVELPRVVIRIAAGTEIIGSIWAVVTEPLTPRQERSFVEAARLVALLLLRNRLDTDTDRRSKRNLLVSLLNGEDSAASAARRAGLGEGPYCVIAVDIDRSGQASDFNAPDEAARLTRIANALDLHLSASHPRSLTSAIGGVVYGLLPLRSNEEARSRFVLDVARDFQERSVRRHPVLVAIGGIVSTFTGIPISRKDADRALRVISSSKTGRGRKVAPTDEVQIETALLELSDRLSEDQRLMSGPIPDLVSFDRSHGTDFIRTLDAFLENFGDVARTAAILHVHPNTCRYRLRKISEVSGLDLEDPDARFSAMLQLRVLGLQ